LKWRPGGTAWADYYDFTNYQQEAFETKKEMVRRCLERSQPEMELSFSS